MAKRKPETTDQDLVRLYLDEIGRHPLLTKDDEARLAQQIEVGRDARAELDTAKGLTPAKKRQLRKLARAGDEATEQFINSNLRLVVSIAKKYQSSDLPLLDLVQEGNLGLIHAVEKFDWRKGFKFSTYATWWIRQAIGRGIDNTSRTIRLPVHAGDQIRQLRKVRAELEGRLGRTPTLAELAAELSITEKQAADLLNIAADPVSLHSPIGEDGDAEFGEIVADASSPSPFDEVAEALLPAALDRLLAPLDDREKTILRLRYGLDRGEPRTLDEIGEVLNLTRERIRQIEKGAIAKLRHPTVLDPEARELLAS